MIFILLKYVQSENVCFDMCLCVCVCIEFLPYISHNLIKIQMQYILNEKNHILEAVYKIPINEKYTHAPGNYKEGLSPAYFINKH